MQKIRRFNLVEKKGYELKKISREYEDLNWLKSKFITLGKISRKYKIFFW